MDSGEAYARSPALMLMIIVSAVIGMAGFFLAVVDKLPIAAVLVGYMACGVVIAKIEWSLGRRQAAKNQIFQTGIASIPFLFILLIH